MSLSHHANNDHAIHDLLKSRWSPYGFADKALAEEDLASLFEAARWAPSCYNDQPWYYIVATHNDSDEFAKLLSCLVEANQAWAKDVPVLALGVARTTFSQNGKPNRHAYHDLGQATALLTVEATSRGLSVHQMAGINPSKARQTYGIPEGFDVVTGVAIGYADDKAEISDELRSRETSPRTRRELDQTVFSAAWGTSFPLPRR